MNVSNLNHFNITEIMYAFLWVLRFSSERKFECAKGLYCLIQNTFMCKIYLTKVLYIARLLYLLKRPSLLMMKFMCQVLNDFREQFELLFIVEMLQ